MKFLNIEEKKDLLRIGKLIPLRVGLDTNSEKNVKNL